MKYATYWQGADGIRNIKPYRGHGIEYPEGFDVIEILSTIIKGRPVVEVGCGYGRLVDAFEPGSYIGLDCNEEAIRRARVTYPDHTFQLIDRYEYPPSMCKLAYTVAMHIPDDEYPEFVEAICTRTGDQVVIAEILGHHRRRKLELKKEGYIHATFGRDRDEHENEFAKHGFKLVTWREHMYQGKGVNFTFLDFRRDFNDAV